MIADIGTYFYENDTSVTKQSHTKESDSGTNFMWICFIGQNSLILLGKQRVKNRKVKASW